MGFPVAGMEYGGECYCGTKLENVGPNGGECSLKCDVPCIGDGSQFCGGDWTLSVYERNNITTPVQVSYWTKTTESTTISTTITTGCVLETCSQYNFTGAWTNTGINWSATSVLIPTKTEACSTPCEVLKYYPYFIWQIHENLRTKIADRLKVDWPERIGAIVGDTCSCEINDIAERIEGCGEVEFGLDGVAEGWVCDVVVLSGKL